MRNKKYKNNSLDIIMPNILFFRKLDKELRKNNNSESGSA